jgi:hypothetical protein
MFFIFGINSGQKKLSSGQLVICNICGSYGRYEVFMTYTSLSLFFIPVLKWGRRYYVTMSCCGTVYELDGEAGRRLAGGENVEISPSDLTLVKEGRKACQEQSAAVSTADMRRRKILPIVPNAETDYTNNSKQGIFIQKIY